MEVNMIHFWIWQKLVLRDYISYQLQKEDAISSLADLFRISSVCCWFVYTLWDLVAY